MVDELKALAAQVKKKESGEASWNSADNKTKRPSVLVSGEISASKLKDAASEIKRKRPGSGGGLSDVSSDV